MEKVKVSVNELVKDIRAQVPDDLIASKYRISVENLVVLKRTLLTNRLISFRELQAQAARSKPRKKVLNAQGFLKDFHERPDDYYLMEKYGLRPRQLSKAYRKLIEKGWLTEFELNSREAKCPELEEAGSSAPIAASTVVTFVEREQGYQPGRVSEERFGGLPKEFFRDHSGVKIGNKAQAAKQNTVHDPIHGECCPKCGAPRVEKSFSFCWSCGTELS